MSTCFRIHLRAYRPGRLSVSPAPSAGTCKGAVLGGCTIPSVYRAHTAPLSSSNTATAIRTRHSRDGHCSCFTYTDTEVLKAKCPARSHRGHSGGTWTGAQASFVTAIRSALWEHRAGHFWVLVHPLIKRKTLS